MRCDECGFVYEAVEPIQLPSSLRTLAQEHADVVLQQSAAVAALRPSPEVWSALEYTCHVRDVFLIQRDRTLLALVEDEPQFPPMYREQRVGLAHYQDERIQEVVGEMLMASNLLAKVFQGLSDDQLERRCMYSYPQPTERTVAWLGSHTLHEAVHHLGDVISVLGQVSPGPR